MKASLFTIILLFSSVVFADTPVGYVKTVAGDAVVLTNGDRQKAGVGSPIFQGSVLQTGKQSSMGVTFNDETLISLGADTQFTIDEYLYAPAKGKLKLSSNLAKGSLNYVSGIIAKLQPEAVSVKTPSGIIGVRGTQFLVKVDDE